MTLIGGDGRDGIWMNGQKNGVIDAGSGNDQVTIGIGGIDETVTLAISLGTGRDLLAIGYSDVLITTHDYNGIVVSDFMAGADGDTIDLGGVLTSGLRLDWIPGTNPFATGQMLLTQQGDDVLLQVDADGAGTFFTAHTMLILSDVQASALTIDNFIYTIPWTGETFELDPHGGTMVQGSAGDRIASMLGADIAAGTLPTDATWDAGSRPQTVTPVSEREADAPMAGSNAGAAPTVAPAAAASHVFADVAASAFGDDAITVQVDHGLHYALRGEQLHVMLV